MTASQALGWIGAGWRTFAGQPLQWLLMALVVFVVMALVSTLIVPLPVFGPMAPPVAFVLLVGSLLVAAERQAQGGTLGFSDLWSGARGHVGSLVLVGVFYSIPLVLLHLVLMLLIGGGLFVGVLGAALGSALNSVLSGLLAFLSAIVTGGLVLLVLWLLMVLCLIFAPALIVFARQPPIDAMGASCRAAMRNLGPVLLFGLCMYLLFMLAMFPLGLGVLLFIPVSVGALRAAWRDLFQIPPAAASTEA